MINSLLGGWAVLIPFFHFSPVRGLHFLDPQAPKRMPASQPGWVYLAPATDVGLRGWAWCMRSNPLSRVVDGELYLVFLPPTAHCWWRDPARAGVHWQLAVAGDIPVLTRRVCASADFEVRVNYRVACRPATLDERDAAMRIWSRMAVLSFGEGLS